MYMYANMALHVGVNRIVWETFISQLWPLVCQKIILLFAYDESGRIMLFYSVMISKCSIFGLNVDQGFSTRLQPVNFNHLGQHLSRISSITKYPIMTRVVKLLLAVIVIVMTDLWSNSNSNSNRLLKIPE